MMPFIQRSDDWKAALSNDDEKRLNVILRRLEKHKTAYMKASNVKTAQIWTALIELDKEKEDIDKRLKRIEYIFDGMVERIREQETTRLKEEKDFKNLLSSLDKF